MQESRLSKKKTFWAVVTIVGFVITIISLYLAVRAILTAWYTPFVIGSYLLFGAITKSLYGASTLSLLVNKPSGWLKLYSYITVFGFLVTEVLGRSIGNFWYYPKFDIEDLVIHVWLIGYPLALFSAIESYWCLLYLIRSFCKSSKLFKPTFMPLPISYFIVVTSLILILSSIIVYFLGFTELNIFVLFVLLILLSFFFDSIANILRKPTILYVGSNPFLLTLLVSAPIIGLLHEVPNTFVWEWVYQNVPFVSVELFKVNILVLTVGWFYLTIIPLSIIHLTISEAYLPITPPRRDEKQ